MAASLAVGIGGTMGGGEGGRNANVFLGKGETEMAVKWQKTAPHLQRDCPHVVWPVKIRQK